ncbi:unnamed protein product [Moneuplotes crassus]|uniref:Uncharacterized protein n=1 Tax=Euplotes crassus TaxID=5936 RepID=A0AAD1U765_EUPCR|nr:unnamed protein product [Moneuplotes crassus]
MARVNATHQKLWFYYKSFSPPGSAYDMIGRNNDTYTNHVIDEETIKLRFTGREVILTSVKLYRWPISWTSVYHQLPAWTEDGNNTLKWNFYSGYASYPSSGGDACQDFLEPKGYCVNKQGEGDSATETCNKGYYLHGRFCYEKCGDGIMHNTPQVFSCDDGNMINGDGCDQFCETEPYHYCAASHLGKSICESSCGNGEKNLVDNESCDDGNIFNGDGCSSECTIEPNNTCTQLDGEISICSPNCGNGVHDPGETCDDKNSMDFDGCNSACQIEPNFVCSYDSALARDLCISMFFPPIVSKNIHSVETFELVYTFNDSMVNYNFTGTDISMSVYSSMSSYDVTWLASFQSATELKVKYAITPLILGGNGEILEVSLDNVNAFISQDKIPISNKLEFKYVFEAIPPTEEAESAGSGTSIMFVATFGLSLMISVLTGSSMELMWSLANTLQILFIMGLLDLHCPSNLKALISYLKYSNFDNPLTKWLSSILIKSFKNVSSPMNKDFSSLGFGSSSIIANSFDRMFLLFMVGIMILLVYLLSKCCKKNCIAKRIEKVDKSLRYESSTRFVVEISMTLSISILINLLYGKLDSLFEIISFMLALLLSVMLILLLIYATVWPIINFEKIKTCPEQVERHCFLFLEFKTNHIKCMMFYSYFTLRRIMIACVVIALQSFPRTQLVCLTILFYWIISYMIVYRPFKCQVNNFLNCVNETFLMVFCITLTNFLNPEDSEKLQLYGYVCIGILGVMFIFNWGIIFPLKIRDSFRGCKEKCHKKTEEEIERERKKKVVISIINSRKLAINKTLPNLQKNKSRQVQKDEFLEGWRKARVYKMKQK